MARRVLRRGEGHIRDVQGEGTDVQTEGIVHRLMGGAGGVELHLFSDVYIETNTSQCIYLNTKGWLKISHEKNDRPLPSRFFGM